MDWRVWLAAGIFEIFFQFVTCPKWLIARSMNITPAGCCLINSDQQNGAKLTKNPPQSKHHQKKKRKKKIQFWLLNISQPLSLRPYHDDDDDDDECLLCALMAYPSYLNEPFIHVNHTPWQDSVTHTQAVVCIVGQSVSARVIPFSIRKNDFALCVYTGTGLRSICHR